MQAKAVWRERWQGWFTWRCHRHKGICWRDQWPRDSVIDQWRLWHPVLSIGCQSQQCSVPFNNNLQARCSCWHQRVLCKVFKSLRLHIECEWWMLSCNVIQIDTWKADFIPPGNSLSPLALVQTYKTPYNASLPSAFCFCSRLCEGWNLGDPYLPQPLKNPVLPPGHGKIL